MFIVLITFHVLVCLALILVVLLQSSKGEGLAGSAFGGGGGISGAVFGGRGAGTFLSKATTILAVVFMLNCVALAFMSSNRTGRGATAAASEDATSVVTREAQAERDRALQQQQQQQTGDSVGTLNLNVSPTPQSDADKAPTNAQEPATTGDGN